MMNQPAKPVWFLRITAFSNISHFKLSTIFTLVIWLLLLSLGLFERSPTSGQLLNLPVIGSAVFVSVWISTVFSLVVYVLNKSQQYVDDLRPVLSCTDEEFWAIQSSIRCADGVNLSLWGCIGILVGGVVQIKLLSLLLEAQEKLPGFYYLLYPLILLLWGMMFQVFSTLINNAGLFGKIVKQHLVVNLLDLKSLSPCSSVAILPAMLAIGLYIVFPLSWIGRTIDFGNLFWPMTFTIPSLVMMFLYPLLPLKKKIKQLKSRELTLINQAIKGDKSAMTSSCLGDDGHNIRLVELIQYRQYISSLNEWGIDAPALKQIGVYFLLPPLTWIAAALVGQLVT